MNLEVENYYLNASGEIIKINGSNKSLNTFLDTSDNEYESNGVCVGDMKIFDIISEIPKELHYKICELINDYYTIPMIRDSITNRYKQIKGLK